MTNSFESIGTQAAEEVLSWVKSAKNLIEEQAPLLVQEALKLEFITSWVWLGIGVLILATGIIAVIMVIRSHDEEFAFFPALGLCLPGLLIIAFQIHDIIQVTVAPRTYVIEYLKDLM